MSGAPGPEKKEDVVVVNSPINFYGPGPAKKPEQKGDMKEQKGPSIPKSYLEKLQTLALDNSMDAQAQLASILIVEGDLLSKQQARSQLEAISKLESESPLSQWARGLCCEYEIAGYPKERAVEYYKKAIDQKYIPAFHSMGLCFLRGNGVAQSNDNAIVCFLEGAKGGCPFSQHALATCYLQEKSGSPNDAQALHWSKQAADQGLIAAHYNVATMLLTGRGGKKSISKGMRHLQIAAESGHMKAQYLLGKSYAEGKGLEKDLALAKEWFQKSAAQGYEKAQTRLASLNGPSAAP